jgi:hypothetical protein
VTKSQRIRPFVVKELRALLPVWIASALAIAAAAVSGPRNHEFGLLAYGFGSVALGSQSIGHEYTSRTLTLLLAQPWSRRWLLLLKFAVLAIMLLTLAAFAWLTLLQPGDQAWVFLSLLNALCVAPLLTMACRTPVAGVVFTGAAPFWIEAIGRYVSAGALWGTALTLFAVAAVAAWRLFMRLEAIEGSGSDLRVSLFQSPPATTGVAADTRRQHPVWLLVKKELHLQQMTFAATGVCTVIWIGIAASTRIIPGVRGFPVSVVAVLYGGLLALLIGSLASAEERGIGTLEWQVMLPMPAWKQWAVKVATTLGLAAAVSFAIPVVLATGAVSFNAWYAGAILAMTIGSVYVSSLCRSSIRALTIAAPIMLGLSMLWAYAAEIYRIGPGGGHLAALTAVPLAIVVTLMLWFALENHRSAGQTAARVTAQVLWIAGSAALGLALVSAIA